MRSTDIYCYRKGRHRYDKVCIGTRVDAVLHTSIIALRRVQWIDTERLTGLGSLLT